ncbi:hypothetical protein BC628DRAFT_1339415 [Trametes gibbosa]|nr:hypothetical protein BC628DRAFT_1339415 [Trametes gibbosa]
MQTKSGVKDAYMQFWIDGSFQQARTLKKDNPRRTIGDIQRLDPTVDTPVELLHTILLGVVKYTWHWLHTLWTVTQKSTYVLRLQATNMDALSVHAIRASYILQYANSLIGWQLKTIAQTVSFHVHDILDPLKFSLWLTVREMTALLWFPEISDLKTYKADLTTAIANVLNLFAEMDPSKIIEKIKLHMLTHAPDNVDQFGRLLVVITEAFELFDGVFCGSFKLLPAPVGAKACPLICLRESMVPTSSHKLKMYFSSGLGQCWVLTTVFMCAE